MLKVAMVTSPFTGLAAPAPATAFYMEYASNVERTLNKNKKDGGPVWGGRKIFLFAPDRHISAKPSSVGNIFSPLRSQLAHPHYIFCTQT